jgi:translation initiation factor IF-2
MTDNDKNNNTRLRLTLKNSPTNISVANKNIASKNSVQVTIKGRKKESIDAIQNSSKEIEARFIAVAKSQQDAILTENELKTHEILKQSLKKQQPQIEQVLDTNQIINDLKKDVSSFETIKKDLPSFYAKEDLHENTNINYPNQLVKSVVESKNIPTTIADINSDINVKNNKLNTSKTEENNKNQKQNKENLVNSFYQQNLDDFQIDAFDVRNKIKQSLQQSNQQKEDRQKIIEQKKQQEQQVLLTEKTELLKKKVKKHTENPIKTTENNEVNKKTNFKNEKFNQRKLTYFVSNPEDEDEDLTGFRRRKFKPKKTENFFDGKEYKKIVREVILPDLITVSDLSARMSEKTGDVVKKLFTMGMVVTSNQAIDTDTAEIIVAEFGHISKRVSHSDIENFLQEDVSQHVLQPRAPVVTIMGHVDHGKTSLLDALRQTNVVAKEHGGITQHIGASRIKTESGKYITFLDTPGHEAFSEMRSRGANVTDIVVLVVAADDGVKEQTVEAINHAKAANVPIIVAVNKIDKPGANPEIVKNELLNYQLVSEEFGGDIMFVPVSAKTKTNLDKLEEAILLQAEILDLKSSYQGKSAGVVLESRVDPSKGVVATMLVRSGTLDIGDLVVVGNAYGKIRKMSDSFGKIVKTATPSVPVEVLGLDYAPNAGDKFVEVEHEKQARDIIAYRQKKEREQKSLKNSAKSITDIFKQSGKDQIKYLNLVIKCDVYGSVEAVSNTIVKLSNQEVAIKIIHSATGGITESDVSLASASNAVIVGFNVRANLTAKDLANLKSVEIRYYSIIYNLVDDLKMLLSGLLNPNKTEEYLGSAEIRQVFKLSGAGKVAGAFVIDGNIKRNAKVRLLRNNVVVYNGSLKTLKRFKEDAKEVKSGFECGFVLENYDDIKEKDIIECYEIIEKSRTL